MNHLRIHQLLGNFLISAGVILIVVLGVRVAKASVENQVISYTDYIVFSSTPVVVFPILPTTMPTKTPTRTAVVGGTTTPVSSPMIKPTITPTATYKSLSQPAKRIVIPSIELNSAIKEVYPTEYKRRGENSSVWQVPKNIVGHHNTSGHPGAGRNIVLSGHNNTGGQVFRRLPKLEPGDEITLYTFDDAFSYRVTEKVIIPYRKNPKKGEDLLQSYIRPTADERLTLYSCYPYLTNANRIVVLAEPIGVSNGG